MLRTRDGAAQGGGLHQVTPLHHYFKKGNLQERRSDSSNLKRAQGRGACELACSRGMWHLMHPVHLARLAAKEPPYPRLIPGGHGVAAGLEGLQLRAHHAHGVVAHERRNGANVGVAVAGEALLCRVRKEDAQGVAKALALSECRTWELVRLASPQLPPVHAAAPSTRAIARPASAPHRARAGWPRQRSRRAGRRRGRRVRWP